MSKKRNVGRRRWAAAAVAVVVALAALAVWAYPYAFKGPEKAGWVRLERGTTLSQLRDTLQRKFGQTYANRVITSINTMGGNVEDRQGAWHITTGTSALRAARKLTRGGQDPVDFTFNNIRTLQELAGRAGRTFRADSAAFISVLTNADSCAAVGKTPQTVIGLIFPDTYSLYWTTTPMEFLRKMQHYYDQFWTSGRKRKAKKLGLTPDQVEVIASIAQEETTKADEVGKVARLYLNRYQKGMRLQADPTIRFALGDFGLQRITKDMLWVDSPYNTYRRAGLPPGPIRFPEKQAVDAFLDSEPSDYLFMCAKPDFSGYHDFAVDYQTHMANAHRYQAELNKRGIR